LLFVNVSKKYNKGKKRYFQQKPRLALIARNYYQLKEKKRKKKDVFKKRVA
jgi:hypothetical protein